ncbi:MAG TPA: M48 family metallopeptidase, partial [Terracidiphilus sp.]|nr:M48 family metallopeptidase [Terracidiphilus sp.]
MRTGRTGIQVQSAAIAAAVVLALAVSLNAQSTPQSTTPQPAPPPSPTTQSTPQTTTPQSTSPSTTPASSTPASTSQPAPGTAPVQGDVQAPPAKTGSQTAADTSSGKKDKKDKKGSKDDAGTQPVSGDVNVDPDKVVEVGSNPIKVKPGSIEDVNAVGNRNIGGRGIGNWYSTDTEIKLGKSYADQVEKSVHLITDPVVVEYVNRIGQNIVKNSDCKVPFTIKVIDSDEINAFALPGGFFYVNSGLILAADEEAELAGVMAHETAHVCAHHAAREMTRQGYLEIGSIPLAIVTYGTWTGYGIYEAAQLAIPVSLLEFSREHEAEADFLGVQYMYKAGYDPQAFIQFFEKLDALEKHKPGAIAKVFADHPQTPSATPSPSSSPSAQSAPGTTPVGGDSSAPASTAPSSTSKQQQPAPG